jgi:hypothetical protein
MASRARRWTLEDTEKLKVLAAKDCRERIAADLGRSASSVVCKARRLGILLRAEARSRSRPETNRRDEQSPRLTPRSDHVFPAARELSSPTGELKKGERVIVAASAGPRLAGRSGVIVRMGPTRSTIRVLLDGSKNCMTLNERYVKKES